MTRSRFQFDALGTHWEIETRRQLSKRVGQRLLARVDAFDAVFSRFRSDSLVAKVASMPQGGRFQFPYEAEALFDLYDRLHAATGGAVDPLVGTRMDNLALEALLNPLPATH